MPHLHSALPPVADLMLKVSSSRLSQSKEICVPLSHVDAALQLVITRGPSLDVETILAWVTNQSTTILVIETPLAKCMIERDPFGSDPQVRLGDAHFTISNRYASLLKSRFGFVEDTVNG